jgi:hypothetical protein
MSLLASEIEKLTFTFTHEMIVRSSLEATFAAILEQLGPGNARRTAARRQRSGEE